MRGGGATVTEREREKEEQVGLDIKTTQHSTTGSVSKGKHVV